MATTTEVPWWEIVAAGAYSLAEQQMAETVRRTQALERYVPGTDLPIIPHADEMRGLAAMAVTLSAAAAVPTALRGKPNDVFLVLLTARDLGMSLTTGMRELHVIEGKVTLSPKVRLSMVRERGRLEGWRVWPDAANDDETAVWHATRADTPGQAFRSVFTWEHARLAGLVDSRCTPLDHWTGNERGNAAKCHCKDNWKRYPQRMVSWRALGYLLDDVFPEVGVGLYQPDEIGAVTDEEGNPVIDVQVADPLPGTSAPRRHGRAAPSEPEPADPEALTDLSERVALLPEAGRDALRELWTAPREGAEPLPPLARLNGRQLVRAEAMVRSIEDRARKGEWGEWPPAPEGPTAPQVAAEAQTVPEAPTTPPAAPQPPQERTWRDGDGGMERAQAVADVVAGLTDPEVGEALRELDLNVPRQPDDARALLKREMLAELDAVTAGAPAPEACSLCGSTRAQLVTVEGVLRCGNATACRNRVGVAAAKNAMAGHPPETPNPADEEPQQAAVEPEQETLI